LTRRRLRATDIREITEKYTAKIETESKEKEEETT